MAETETTWRARLLPASYNGKPCHVESTDESGGRRQVVVSYPGRDQCYIEDLGVDVDGESVTLFTVGDDYQAEAQALVAEFKRVPLGVLVHPRLGPLRLRPKKWQVSTRVDTGPYAVITLELLPAGENAPAAATDTHAAVSDKAERLTAAQRSAFAQAFDVARHASHVAGDALQRVNAITRSLREGLAVVGQMSGVGQVGASAVTDLGATLGELLSAPRTLAGAISNAVGSVIGAAASVQAALNAHAEIVTGFDDYPAIPDIQTPSRDAQRTNAQALDDLVTVTSLTATVQRIVELAPQDGTASPFNSYDQAAAVRDALLTQIDALIDEAPDEIFLALRELRVAFVEHMQAHGVRLSRVTSLTIGDSLPVLVVAHRLYGSAALADDIAARNGVRHPLFVPSGAVLEVLAHG